MYACVVQVFIHEKIEGDDVHTTPSYIHQTPDSLSVTVTSTSSVEMAQGSLRMHQNASQNS